MMDFRKFCKAFMAGMFFPALFLTLMYTMLYCCSSTNIQTFPAQFFVMYIPVLFGITNCLYKWVGDCCPIKDFNLRLWVTGGILGLIVALFGVFVFNIPSLLFNFSGILVYFPLIFMPIVYGAIFRYIVKWLNTL